MDLVSRSCELMRTSSGQEEERTFGWEDSKCVPLVILGIPV